MNNVWPDLVYLLASVLFILGIKGLTHPRTAVRGNLISAVGMILAVAITFMLLKDDFQVALWVVLGGIVVGSVIGGVMALKVKMTAMPQMVAFFNGLGGAASTLVAWAELFKYMGQDPAVEAASMQSLIACAAAGLIGVVTFWGSLVAYAKLEELKSFKKPLALPFHQLINLVLFLAVVGLGFWLTMVPQYSPWIFLLLVIVATPLGFFLVTPIGGADMPVVIALLNSYSGLAAAATGFVISNNVLIIAGSLVGASGIILTAIMCKAMNRSLANVLFAKIDASAATATADEVYEGKIKATSAEEIAMMLDGVQRVVIVPGYGMAVAQAQHSVRDLYNQLQSRGVNVEFAIHPVAGRMPGHMNVLLAEVDIPYDKLVEMDQINPTFPTVDVAIVLGANDVVNPDARENPQSPIAGMPILNVDEARTVIVIKRSLSPGFAGIPNPLFAKDNTLMFFADGDKAIKDIVSAIKENS